MRNSTKPPDFNSICTRQNHSFSYILFTQTSQNAFGGHRSQHLGISPNFLNQNKLFKNKKNKSHAQMIRENNNKF